MNLHPGRGQPCPREPTRLTSRTWLVRAPSRRCFMVPNALPIYWDWRLPKKRAGAGAHRTGSFFRKPPIPVDRERIGDHETSTRRSADKPCPRGQPGGFARTRLSAPRVKVHGKAARGGPGCFVIVTKTTLPCHTRSAGLAALMTVERNLVLRELTLRPSG